MKYRAVDSLHDFEFHDSVWELASYESGALVLQVYLLNVHENAAQNTGDCDMEIKLAQLTFSDCNILSFCPGVTWQTDASGKSYPTEPIITYTGREAVERLINELRYGTTVFAFKQEEGGSWNISAMGDEPYFEAQLSFGSAAVEWDELARPAWYVRRMRGLE